MEDVNKEEDVIEEKDNAEESEEVKPTEDNSEEDYKAKAERLAAEKAEVEKKLKTALIQKEKKDEKLKNAVSAASNNEVESLKAEMEYIKFQTSHNDLSSDEIKLISRLRQSGQSLEDAYNDAEIKDIIDTKRMKKEMDEGIVDFSTRSSSSGAKGMSAIEAALSGNLPPGYKAKK